MAVQTRVALWLIPASNLYVHMHHTDKEYLKENCLSEQLTNKINIMFFHQNKYVSKVSTIWKRWCLVLVVNWANTRQSDVHSQINNLCILPSQHSSPPNMSVQDSSLLSSPLHCIRPYKGESNLIMCSFNWYHTAWACYNFMNYTCIFFLLKCLIALNI